jgi:uncharacterized protein (TIGR00266 family)
MQIEIIARPGASAAKLTLGMGETVVCEVGAMIAMSAGVSVETSSQKRGAGGLMRGLRRMFAGENFFLNHFSASAPDQTLFIGPGMLGDITHHAMRGGSLIVQGSSWLAASSEIVVDASFQGLTNALFSGEGMFWVKCSGQGDLLLSSFGAIYEVAVDGQYVVDTGHIVAFEDTLQFGVGKAGRSLLGSLLGGEGLVCKFEGQGKLYCQSHNPPSLGKLLGPKLKPR